MQDKIYQNFVQEEQILEAELALEEKKAIPIAFLKEISHDLVLVPSAVLTPTAKVDPLDVVPCVTLKTSNLLVWVAGSTVFVLTCDSVEEILIPEADQIIYSRRQRFLHWLEQMIPVYRLSELLSDTDPLPKATSRQALADKLEPMLVISQGQQILSLDLEIEYLVTEPELVIKPFGIESVLPSYVYGCTIWKDRRLQVIDVAALLSHRIGQSPTASADVLLSKQVVGNKITPAITTVKQPTVLVVDDSNSVRQIISLTLQRAGYQVLQAEDGQEAIAKLQKNSRVQLVICDIDMPNVNGFKFLSHRLQDPLLAKIPVVMLSTCSSNKHHQLARQLGATAYFTKPYVEQEFLAEIEVIIAQNTTNL